MQSPLIMIEGRREEEGRGKKKEKKKQPQESKVQLCLIHTDMSTQIPLLMYISFGWANSSWNNESSSIMWCIFSILQVY